MPDQFGELPFRRKKVDVSLINGNDSDRSVFSLVVPLNSNCIQVTLLDS
jgi:hypothetical protein